jgi:hypothetical protein
MEALVLYSAGANGDPNSPSTPADIFCLFVGKKTQQPKKPPKGEGANFISPQILSFWIQNAVI